MIELLVVISIVAILSAMLLPALSKAREKAYQATCMGNQKQAFMAMTMYGEDYNDWWPTPMQWGADYGNLAFNTRPMALGLVYEYVNDGLVLQCPALFNTRNSGVTPESWAKGLDQAIATQSGSARTSYFLERVWDGNSVNHVVLDPFKRPHFGYRYVGSKQSSNIDNKSKDNKRFSVLPMLQCHQCPYWHYNMTHKGRGGNVCYTDGSIMWFNYDYLGLNHHIVQVSWTRLLKNYHE